MNPECYEGVSSGLKQLDSSKRFMKLVGLEKEYGNGTKAVNGINLKLYADQIFVLLGHNGAGKTSTISLLTGLYDPSKGSAEAFGIDMFKDFKQIR
jgi:ATP-binding cassette subfamily A (ABC1) protein 3